MLGKMFGSRCDTPSTSQAYQNASDVEGVSQRGAPQKHLRRASHDAWLSNLFKSTPVLCKKIDLLRSAVIAIFAFNHYERRNHNSQF